METVTLVFRTTVSTTDAGSAPKSEFSAEFRTELSEVAGKPTKLIINIKDANGAAVRDLGLSNEKPLHLIVVSSDLSTATKRRAAYASPWNLTILIRHLDEKTGIPVSDLQRYLGAPAYLVII